MGVRMGRVRGIKRSNSLESLPWEDQVIKRGSGNWRKKKKCLLTSCCLTADEALIFLIQTPVPSTILRPVTTYRIPIDYYYHTPNMGMGLIIYFPSLISSKTPPRKLPCPIPQAAKHAVRGCLDGGWELPHQKNRRWLVGWAPAWMEAKSSQWRQYFG